MKLEVTNEKKNPLVNRTEIKAHTTSDVNPKKFDVAKVLAEKYSVPVDNIRVLTIYGKYGTNEFDIAANIYESKEERDKVELYSKKEKEAEAKAIEAEAAPAEEAKEEPKAEEPKAEEPKAEEAAPVETPVEEAKPEEKAEEAAPVEEATK